MTPGILFFAGPIASGKSSLAKIVAQEWDCRRVSFSTILRAEAIARHLEPTRETLQSIGTDWVTRDPQGLCERLIHDTEWTASQRLVVDGLRHRTVAESFKSIVEPVRALIVYVDAGFEIRRQRVITESGGDHLPTWDLHPAEQEVTDLVPIADLVLTNETDLSSAASTLLDWIRREWRAVDAAPRHPQQ